MDKNDKNVTSDDGYAMNLNFFDKLGYKYTAKFAVKVTNADAESYTVELTDILDSENNSVLSKFLEKGGKLAQVFGQNTTATKTYPITNENIHYAASDLSADIKAGNYYYTYTDYNAGGQPLTKYAKVTLDKATNSYKIDAYSKYETADAAQAGGAKTPVAEQTGSMTELFGITTGQLNYLGATGLPTAQFNADTGAFEYVTDAVNYTLKFNPADGTFSYVGAEGSPTVKLNLAETLGNNFEDITIDFSTCKAADNGGKTSLGADAGSANGSVGKGKALGALTGILINNNGKIYGSYDNGNTVLLGQIAVAQFANASGLQKVGENCYTTTLNSGEFDGIGVEVAADGASMTSGELEMSNVDLSTEFTQMIITQRGFQSNSRVITTSDTLLEELINLKR